MIGRAGLARQVDILAGLTQLLPSFPPFDVTVTSAARP
jgi:hypothetical protein